MNWKDIAERSLWTAAQAFLSAFGGSEALSSLGAAKSAALAGAIAAGAALLSLVKNVVKQHVESLGGE